MAPRALGALLALVAAIALVVSVASSSWWSGHPDVEGRTITAKVVRVGLLGATGCNTGGDGSCESLEVGGTMRLAGLVELGAIGLVTVLAFMIAISAWTFGDRRKLLAKAMLVAVLLAVVGAAFVLLVGPSIEATQHVEIPIGWGTFVFGGAMVAALLSSAIVVKLEREPLRLRSGMVQLSPPPDMRDLVRESRDGLRPTQLGPEPMFPNTGSGSQARMSAPMFEAAPQLRPLYDPTNQGYFPAPVSPPLPVSPPTVPQSVVDALTGNSTPMPDLGYPQSSSHPAMRAHSPTGSPSQPALRTHSPTGSPSQPALRTHSPTGSPSQPALRTHSPTGSPSQPALRTHSPTGAPPQAESSQYPSLRDHAASIAPSTRPSSPQHPSQVDSSQYPSLRDHAAHVAPSTRPSSPSVPPPLRGNTPSTPPPMRSNTPSAAPPVGGKIVYRGNTPSVAPPLSRGSGPVVPMPARTSAPSVAPPISRGKGLSVPPPTEPTVAADSSTARRARTVAGPGTEPAAQPLQRASAQELAQRSSMATRAHAVPPMPAPGTLAPPSVLPARETQRAATDHDDRLDKAMRETDYVTGVEVDEAARLAAARTPSTGQPNIGEVTETNLRIETTMPNTGEMSLIAPAPGPHGVESSVGRPVTLELHMHASPSDPDTSIGRVTSEIAQAVRGALSPPASSGTFEMAAQTVLSSSDPLAGRVTSEMAAQTALSSSDPLGGRATSEMGEPTTRGAMAPPGSSGTYEMAAQTAVGASDPLAGRATSEMAAQTAVGASDPLADGAPSEQPATRGAKAPPASSGTFEMAAQTTVGAPDPLAGDSVVRVGSLTGELAAQRMTGEMAVQESLTDQLAAVQHDGSDVTDPSQSTDQMTQQGQHHPLPKRPLPALRVPDVTGPRAKVPMSTAPANLKAPKLTEVAASGPTPACPQCESPMAWVEEHLRFYCKHCRMYF